jgi:hypothetical protein
MKIYFRFGIFIVLTCFVSGCEMNLVRAGDNGIFVQRGEWIGKNESGSYIIDFIINGGSSITVTSYSYPCGEENSYVLPPQPIIVALSNSSFTFMVDYSDLNPKYIINGTFTESNKVEGTWESFDYQNIYEGIICLGKNGEWKGTPQ